MPNNKTLAIPCPVCNTKITFDVQLLIQGAKFTCPNCQAAIGIASSSKPLLKNTIEKLEQLKAKIDEKK